MAKVAAGGLDDIGRIVGRDIAEGALADAAQQIIKDEVILTAQAASREALAAGATAATKTASSSLRAGLTSFAKGAGSRISRATTFVAKRVTIKNTLIVAALAGGAYMVINPKVEHDKKNGSSYNITRISDYSTTSGIAGDTAITYTPGVSLYDGSYTHTSATPDTLMFSNTGTVLDGGSYPVRIVISQNMVVINIGSNFTYNGNPSRTPSPPVDGNPSYLGTMTLSTSYENQAALSAVQSGRAFGAAGASIILAGSTAAATIANQAVASAKDIARSLFDGLGINWNYIKYGALAILVIIVLVIIFKIYKTFKSTSAFGRRRRY